MCNTYDHMLPTTSAICHLERSAAMAQTEIALIGAQSKDPEDDSSAMPT